MKKLFIFFASLIIGIGLFIWVTQTVGWDEIKSAFLLFSGWKGLAILVLSFLMILSGVWKWKQILKNQGHNIPIRSLFWSYLGGFSISYFAPMMVLGGEAFRGFIVREKFAVPWPKAMASVIIDRILELTVYLLVLFSGIIFIFLEMGLPPRNVALILGGILIISTILIIFFYVKIFKRESIVRFFIKLFDPKYSTEEPLEVEKELFRFFKLKNSYLWKALSLTFLKVTITCLRTWILVFFLGETIGIASTVSITASFYLALMTPIPAVVGVHEMTQTFTFGSLGLGGAGTGVVFTMIIRGAEVIVSLVGIVILCHIGIGLLRKGMFRRIDKLTNGS